MDITPASLTNIVLKYYSYILNFLLISAYIGVGITKPVWMTTVDYYLKIFISMFLLYRFNSFRERITFEELDRRIVFTAGIILFTSTIVNDLLLSYSETYRKQIISLNPIKVVKN